VVEVDEVVLDIGQVIRREIVLAGDDALADRAVVGEVEVRRERATVVVHRELVALNLALVVVERGIDQRGAELALVLDALHVAPVAVEADGPGIAEFL
jgi:hypothetical protein